MTYRLAGEGKNITTYDDRMLDEWYDEGGGRDYRLSFDGGDVICQFKLNDEWLNDSDINGNHYLFARILDLKKQLNKQADEIRWLKR